MLRRILYGLAGLLVLYVLTLLVYGYFSDWVPEEKNSITAEQTAEADVVDDSLLHFVTWNVGYGGLGAESDFFYDDEGMFYSGGSMIRAPKELVEKNNAGAVNFLKTTKSDFFLLQEVDIASDRSYRLPQYDLFCNALPGYTATMALNYQCPRVPIPLLEPWNAYGAVKSGLGTFSKYKPTETTRYQLPGHYPMPDRMFQLDRCVALHRFKTKWGKDLIVINLHNAAYDPGDKIKAIQLPYLRTLALAEYEKGNYVVMGGDWNQCPPYFRFDQFMPGNTQGYGQGNVPGDFFPEDWRFAYDPAVPTNRKCRNPYVKGKTFETLIDFFLVSPNVQVKSIKGMNQDFQFSDHQPVSVELSLITEK